MNTSVTRLKANERKIVAPSVIVCIEHDHGRRCKKGDIMHVDDPENYIYTMNNWWNQIENNAKWRLASSFEIEAWNNGVTTIKPYKL